MVEIKPAVLNLDEFTKEIDLSSVKLEEDLWLPFYKSLSLQLLRLIVMGTPVDTGRARGNWQLAINSPQGGTTERTDKAGDAVLADANAALVAVKDFEAIWLSNNLPYILRLEEGSSSQAPEGFVAKAIDAIERHINDEFAQLESQTL